MLKIIDSFDLKVSNFLYPRLHGKFFVIFSSHIGSFYFSVVFFTILFFSPLSTSYLLCAIYAFLISTILVFVGKYVFKRERFISKSIGVKKKLDPFSFPSGHVSRIAAIAAPFLSSFSWTVCVLLLMCITSFSRIARGFHFFSDCIVGAIIGMVSAYASLGLMPYFNSLC